MYVFADTPDRADFLRLAQYIDASEDADRTAPTLTPIRSEVCTRLLEIASSPSRAPDEKDRQRYQALRLFVR